MKDLIVGLAVGIAIGYVARFSQEKGSVEALRDDVNKLAFKTKRMFKDVVDTTRNKAEYIKDRADYELSKTEVE